MPKAQVKTKTPVQESLAQAAYSDGHAQDTVKYI
jgi:hypothetical protein